MLDFEMIVKEKQWERSRILKVLHCRRRIKFFELNVTRNIQTRGIQHCGTGMTGTLEGLVIVLLNYNKTNFENDGESSNMMEVTISTASNSCGHVIVVDYVLFGNIDVFEVDKR
jgi:hypothetical protein